MDTTHNHDQQAQPVAEQPAMIPEPSPEQQQQVKFMCDLCEKDGFRSLQAVRGHKSTHTRNFDTIVTTTSTTAPYICLVCGMEFDSEESLLRHVTSDHYEDMASNCIDDDYAKSFDLSKKLPLSWPLKGKRNRASSHGEASASNNNVRLESEDYTRLLLMAEVCASVASGTPLLPKDDPCLAHAELVVQIGCKRRRLDDNYVRTLPAAPANRDGKKRNDEIQCKLCEKIFSSHQALGGHMTSHKRAKNSSPDRNNGECNRNEQPKVYSCKDCDRKFASSQALGGHRSSPLCKHNKNHSHNNSAHVIVVENNNDVVEAHGQDREQVHKCNDCNKEFKTHHALGGHLSSHLKNKKSVNANQDRTNSADTSTSSAENKNEQQTMPIHKCKHCELIFPTGQALGGHQRLHNKPPVETKQQSSSGLEGLLVMISICRLRRRMEYTRRN